MILADLKIIHQHWLVDHIHRGDDERLALFGLDVIADVQQPHRRPASAFREERVLRRHAQSLATPRRRVDGQVRDPRGGAAEEVGHRAQIVVAAESIAPSDEIADLDVLDPLPAELRFDLGSRLEGEEQRKYPADRAGRLFPSRLVPR